MAITAIFVIALIIFAACSCNQHIDNAERVRRENKYDNDYGVIDYLNKK